MRFSISDQLDKVFLIVIGLIALLVVLATLCDACLLRVTTALGTRESAGKQLKSDYFNRTSI